MKNDFNIHHKMLGQFYANRILLDKRFFKLLNMVSLLEKKLRKIWENLKSVKLFSLDELNETFSNWP